MSAALDRRLNAFRPDLADKRLEGKVESTRFVSGEPARVQVPCVNLRPNPSHDAGIDTQALYGESVRVFDRHEGWAWVSLDADAYVGYLPESALGNPMTPTHRVMVPRTFCYSGPDLRFPDPLELSAASLLTIVGEAETRGTRYALLEGGGAVIAAHIRPLSAKPDQDPVTVASRFLETPYLWGGRSGFGIDCSGLVQISHALCGIACPRDSDMQAAGFGTAFDPEERSPLRGDLVFWKGHVGLLEDPETLIHASGGTMNVTREPLQRAIERIAVLYGRPTGWRRPPST